MKKAKLSEKMSEVIKIKGLNKIFKLQKFLKTETPYFLEHILLFHVAPENLGPPSAPGWLGDYDPPPTIVESYKRFTRFGSGGFHPKNIHNRVPKNCQRLFHFTTVRNHSFE